MNLQKSTRKARGSAEGDQLSVTEHFSQLLFSHVKCYCLSVDANIDKYSNQTLNCALIGLLCTNLNWQSIS